jgi:NAD(P)-dependent dehydrogenase (short-subunit alcohol dehydrogenase family)
MGRIIIVTGASSGFGRLAANALAKAGDTVYASMRETQGRDAKVVADVAKFAGDNDADPRSIELDVGSQDSVDAAIAQIIADHGRIDVVVHNAGHVVFGPAEAFTPEQLAELYDVNVLSTLRVNRAVLPQMRRQKNGFVGLGIEQQLGGRDATLSGPIFRSEGGHGRHGGHLRQGIVTLGH